MTRALPPDPEVDGCQTSDGRRQLPWTLLVDGADHGDHAGPSTSSGGRAGALR